MKHDKNKIAADVQKVRVKCSTNHIMQTFFNFQRLWNDAM